MKVLFIGGTGLISTAASTLAVQQGMELYLLTRGRQKGVPPEGANVLRGDINDRQGMRELLEGKHFDAVVDWIAFKPEDIERDVELFAGKTDQYIFISTVATYQRPPSYYLFDESAPQHNPGWPYAVDKIACEERLLRAYRETGFPATIVRPSHTYGETAIPFAITSGAHPWTLIDRIRKGKKIIVPGDGTSLWTITHNTDFAKGLVGLLGNSQTIGQAFHITSDEVKTWNQYLAAIGQAAGAKPEAIHMTSACISLFLPEFKAALFGDASNSYVVDNRKIKAFVPGYQATTNFERGIRQSLAYFESHPERQTIDEALDARMDKMIASYENFLASIV
ncbi:SDR family oxidoreductase [Paenibacillus sacheonensis]|uniref:NAD-dependent epimerase/dehydratase family protein n=1 Tax=Paenibacillus sacheonensis TaxID=742054 RepID=A0A7X4YPW7_9BACL|nr:SDR family oxidoreductase [Paenibacillus sacheonensis]MBM7566120.1 nucleoside-diphosphate-sugar epimerase [Paenibacillus sacheonensis]NBC70333.1 NAD-dependent epimerase/dehydratase family protein [Paenibacillus sacheonensis]